MADEAT